MRRRWLVAALLLPQACSLLAPTDEELVGRRPPDGASGSTTGGTDTSPGGLPGVDGGAPVVGVGGEGGQGDEGGNHPGKPWDVGVPEGEWAAGPGLKTRWAAEVDPARPHADYPRPQLTRHDWATLNGLWEYAINDSGDSAPVFDGQLMLVPFPLESQLSGVSGGALADDEFLWYRRLFNVPDAWRGKQLILHFGAVDYDASVRINGTEVVTHQGGYDGFSVDITAQLSAEPEQEIVVRVADPTDSGTQLRGKQALLPDTGNSLSAVSGIWQSVWLEPVPTLSLQGVRIESDRASGDVSITPELSGAAAGTSVRAIVFFEGSQVGSGEAADGAAIELNLSSPQAWTPDSPNLYDVTLELVQGGVVVDSADAYFGMRSVALTDDAGVSRMALNGEPFISMAVLAQGYWPEGLYTPPSDAALKADVTLIKNLGFNAVRVHGKLESRRFYYWADRLGVLVWQDVPAGENSSVAAREAFSAELSALVSERAQHPSLAVWTLFNGPAGAAGADVPQLVDQLKTLTSQQLVIGATGPSDDGSGDLRDRPEVLNATGAVPDTRGTVLGQYGSFSRAITGHTWGGGSGTVQTATDTARSATLVRKARGLAQNPGISGSVFRQLTDVENELDGLVTYDRAVTKITAKAFSDAVSGVTPEIRPLLQASEFPLLAAYANEAQQFRYTTTAPAAQWLDKVFNDGAWTEASAGIGDTADAGARIRTKLAFDELWARTTFTLAEKPAAGSHLIVRMMFDEDTQVYVNSIRAVDTYGWVTTYQDFLGSVGAVEALVEGENTIAVHTNNTNGGRYMDVGLWITDEPPAYREPDLPGATTAGLEYFDYDLTLDSLPSDIGVNTPRATGVSTTIGSYAPALASDNTRALRFHGYIEVVEDGVFTFWVDTDDGARLSIGTQRVAESFRNDGTNVTRRAGNIALAAGKHEITIDYFANDNQGTNTFGVTWAGPGFPQQNIEAGNLSH